MPGKTGSMLSVNVLSRHKAPGNNSTSPRKWKIIKNTLGALYTELKGKVVQRHHRLNAIARIEKMINDLPSSGDPEAEQKFTALENTLNAARPHLGELYEAYKTTLTDMKPEYIGS